MSRHAAIMPAPDCGGGLSNRSPYSDQAITKRPLRGCAFEPSLPRRLQAWRGRAVSPWGLWPAHAPQGADRHVLCLPPSLPWRQAATRHAL